MTGYDFHREARLDLEHIWEFVAIDNVDAANRLIEEILASVRALVPFPNGVRDYLIAYAPEEKPLWVVAVLHGRISPRTMAAILRDRE